MMLLQILACLISWYDTLIHLEFVYVRVYLPPILSKAFPVSLTFLLTRLHYKAALKLLVQNICHGVVHGGLLKLKMQTLHQIVSSLEILTGKFRDIYHIN
jgi:ABC-type transport system involved in cytochrome bd biosynthesis fused ATPase/permease subunit